MLRTRFSVRYASVLFFLLVIARNDSAQTNLVVTNPAMGASGAANAQQTATILGFNPLMGKLQGLVSQRACESAPSMEELMVRQQIVELVQTSVLDVDGVLAELSNERGELLDLRVSLQARRDRIVAKLNAVALIAGSGFGAAVNATQFTGLSNRVQNTGDAIGIGSGVASTFFSILATRKQNGPSEAVGEIPNMLAPLFNRKPVLNAYYSPQVLQYLQSVPANEDAKEGTRLEQLKAQWTQAGRLGSSSDPVKQQQKITSLTTSENNDVKISISNLSDRIAMLQDVAGRVSLMKRDLAGVMHAYMADSGKCPTKTDLNR